MTRSTRKGRAEKGREQEDEDEGEKIDEGEVRTGEVRTSLRAVSQGATLRDEIVFCQT